MARLYVYKNMKKIVQKIWRLGIPLGIALWTSVNAQVSLEPPTSFVGVTKPMDMRAKLLDRSFGLMCIPLLIGIGLLLIGLRRRKATKASGKKDGLALIITGTIISLLSIAGIIQYLISDQYYY